MRRASIMKIGLCAAIALGVALGGCVIHIGDNLNAKASRVEELGAPAAGIASLDVNTNVGTIKLQTSDVDEVLVTAEITIKATTQEEADGLLEEVRIEVEPSGDTLRIRAIKPPDLGRNQMSADFTITAPAALGLKCTANVGDIRIDGFTQCIEAHTDVGSITCAGLRERVNLHTNVGDIKVMYAPEAPAALEASAGTNVGNIDFTGPQEISAKLTASANVGSIHTDRPLTVTGSMKQSINASLGNAEGRIDLHTNVGSITIH